MNKVEISNSYGLLKTNNQIYVLDKQSNIIGKHSSSNIILSHPTASRDHALIEFNEKNEGFLKDLNSTNGCYINDARLKDGSMMKLKNYDKIRFAKDPMIYLFEYNSKDQNNVSDKPKDNFSILDEKISLVKNNFYPKTVRNHLAKSSDKNRLDHNNINFNINPSKAAIENKFKNSYVETEKNYEMKNYTKDGEINKDARKITNNSIRNDKESHSPKFNSLEVANDQYDLNLTFKHNNVIGNVDNNDLNNSTKMGEEHKIKLYEELYLKIEKLTKANENINSKNMELEEKSLNQTNEIKKLNNNFEQVNEEYNKLNAKHNALLIYASDIQKKVDLLELEYHEKGEEINRFRALDWGRLLIERDNVIKILQTDVNFYKNELNTIKSNLLSSQKLYGNDVTKRMDSLLENYLTENKKNKKILEEYKSRENDCNKKWNELLKENNLNIEKNNLLKQQLNEQNNQFNKTISDFDKRMLEALNKIPRFLENFDQKKSEAAQFLVDQMNLIMEEKRKLMEEYSNLNNLRGELLFDLEKLKQENRNYNAYFELSSPMNSFNSNNPQFNNNINLKFFKNKIEELEDLLSQYKNNCSPHKMVELEESLGKHYEKLIEKDQIIEGLQIKLKEYLKKNNVIFDEKQAVYSLTKALREKDIIILNLKTQIKDMKDIERVKALEIDNLSRIADKHFENNTKDFEEFNNVKEKVFNPSIFIEKVENMDDYNNKTHIELK